MLRPNASVNLPHTVDPSSSSGSQCGASRDSRPGLGAGWGACSGGCQEPSGGEALEGVVGGVLAQVVGGAVEISHVDLAVAVGDGLGEGGADVATGDGSDGVVLGAMEEGRSEVLLTGQPGPEPAKAASSLSGGGRLTSGRRYRCRGRRWRHGCRLPLLPVRSRIRGRSGRGRDAGRVRGGWLGYWWHLCWRCLGWALLDGGGRARIRCRCRAARGLSSLACIEIDRPRGRCVVGALDVDQPGLVEVAEVALQRAMLQGWQGDRAISELR